MLDLNEHIYCIVEKEEFTNQWYKFAKGGALNPTYIDFFVLKDSAIEARHQLESHNPELRFDVMKTQYQSFINHWTRSTEWNYD